MTRSRCRRRVSPVLGKRIEAPTSAWEYQNSAAVLQYVMAARHQDWLRQADADLRHARQARDHGAHEWACFAAQQAAEKSIKAVILSRGADAWGPTVTALLGLVTTAEQAGEELITCAKSLDKHYLPTRYPNGFDTGAPVDFYTRKDSDDAIPCAERLISFARSQIEQPEDRRSGCSTLGP